MDTNAVIAVLPGLAALAVEPFDVESYEARCSKLDWEISRESWWPNTCFRAWLSEAKFHFMAIFEEDETSAGLSIGAVGDHCEDPDFYVADKEELDKVFSRVLQITVSTYGPPSETGQYQREFESGLSQFACWVYSQAFLLLIEHCQQEYSNDPSLEFRLIPRLGKDSPNVPFQTDLYLC